MVVSFFRLPFVLRCLLLRCFLGINGNGRGGKQGGYYGSGGAGMAVIHGGIP